MTKRTPEETARRKARTAARAQQDALAGRVPVVGKKTTTAHAVLVEHGVAINAMNVVGVINRTSYGPMRVDQTIGPAQPKPVRIESPTWLALVRCLPCGCCARGRAFEESLRLAAEAGDWKAGAQSEANHHPAKGMGGGGSDFLTHPACTPCHRKITERHPDAQVMECGLAVAKAQAAIFLAIRSGALQIATLVACSVEAMVNAETR